MVTIDYNDIGKSHLEILTDLLYESTKTRIPLSKISFGTPKELDLNPEDKTDENTFIPVTVATDYSTLFQAGSGLMYRRIEITDYLQSLLGSTIELHATALPAKLCDILPQINTFLEFPLDCGDVLDATITQAGVQDIKIKIQLGSFIWVGEITIRVNVIVGALIPLYTTTMLQGFDVYGDGTYSGLPN